MNRLLLAGNDVTECFRRIERVYGVMSVTRTINKMKPDERNGGASSTEKVIDSTRKVN